MLGSKYLLTSVRIQTESEVGIKKLSEMVGITKSTLLRMVIEDFLRDPQSNFKVIMQRKLDEDLKTKHSKNY